MLKKKKLAHTSTSDNISLKTLLLVRQNLI